MAAIEIGDGRIGLGQHCHDFRQYAVGDIDAIDLGRGADSEQAGGTQRLQFLQRMLAFDIAQARLRLQAGGKRAGDGDGVFFLADPHRRRPVAIAKL